MSEEIMVTVARTGAPALQVALNGDHTVGAALRAANVTPKSSEAFKVSGIIVGEDYELDDEDRLFVVQNIEGGR
jgi:sulfur carrier protein ThiS